MFAPPSPEELRVQFLVGAFVAFQLYIISRKTPVSGIVINLFIAADFFLLAVAIGYVFFWVWTLGALPFIFTGLFIFSAILLIVWLVNRGEEWPKEAQN
jgi:hypothetical protein